MKKKMNLMSISAAVAVSFVIAGCGSDAKTSAILDDEDIRMLANMDNSAVGSAQTSIEIIPAPVPAAPVQASMDTIPQEVVAEISVSAPKPSVTVAQTTAISDAHSFEEKVQVALQKSGYYSGSIDGKIGPNTRESIKAFQEAHGLTADGMAGKNTWTKLKEYYYAE